MFVLMLLEKGLDFEGRWPQVFGVTPYLFIPVLVGHRFFLQKILRNVLKSFEGTYLS